MYHRPNTEAVNRMAHSGAQGQPDGFQMVQLKSREGEVPSGNFQGLSGPEGSSFEDRPAQAVSPLIARPRQFFSEELTPYHSSPDEFSEASDVSPELSTAPYTADETHWVRNALKLSTKFLIDEQVAKGKTWGPSEDLPMVALTGEIGLLLVASGVPSEQIAAAMLYSPLQYADVNKAKKFLEVVERKFGRGLTQQLVQTYDLLENPERINKQNAHLACAILLAEISSGHISVKDERVDALAEKFERLGVNRLLLDQLRVDQGHAMRADLEPYSGVVRLSLSDVIELRNGVRMAGRLFKDADRKWGPHERLPLMAHATEVGLILAMAGQSKDLIVAGLLHDALEGYSPEEQGQVAEKLTQCLTPNTVRLIQAVTEPQKAAGGVRESDPLRDFYSRKMAIVQQVENGDTEAAILSCATKISTMGAGLKHLWVTKGEVGLTGWSSGTLAQNLAFFELHQMQYRNKGVPPVMVEQYQDGLRLMARYLQRELAAENSANGA